MICGLAARFPVKLHGLIKDKDSAVEGHHMTNWNECPAVERTPGKASGAWVFSGTRIPL